ncbi:MAG TPA: hypothetical protein VN253_07485 [Kofleriaceae bacterium]|nr:hypothetical protein [Kofleriaceae bacterium]
MRARAVPLAAAAAAALAVAGGGAGCDGKKRQKRSGDSPPVEIIATPNLGSGSAAGKPAESDEHEPNDGADVATPLALGATVRGKIEPDTDVDYYRIDVAQAGGLSVTLSAAAGVDLSLEIEDAGGTVLARSDRGAVNVVEGVPNLGVTPGRYTAVVRKKPPPAKKPARVKKGAPPPPPPEPPEGAPAYQLSAQVAPFGKNAEREPDDDRGTANDLILGDTVTGYIGWTGDADVWKLSVEALSAKNVLDLELSAVENVAFTVEVADGIGQPLLVRKAPKGAALSIHGLAPVVPPGAPPFHYVTVKADRSNPETPYHLKVTGRVPGADAETEPNDTPDKPMAIPADRTVVREAYWSPGDVDCFAVAPDPAARTIEVTIEPPAEADLRLELFVNGRSTATAGQKKTKGSREKVSGAVPADGRAVVCVRGTDASKEGTYDLSVHEGPDSP